MTDIPFMTHMVPEPPGLFSSTLAEWEQYLTKLRSYPDSVVMRGAISDTERKIAEIKNPELVLHITLEEAVKDLFKG